MSKPLFDITPFTLLDYPDKSACILWFAGCNMRCLYCYNPDIVLGKGKISVDKAISFLASRKGLLQAVVLSGGECTLHPEVLEIARKAKSLGYLVKVDTNGTKPNLINAFIEEGLLDYVALDFKGLGNQFKRITVTDTFKAFETTFNLLLHSTIPFEIRSTIHPYLIKEADLAAMIEYLELNKYEGTYYLQPALAEVEMLAELPHTSISSGMRALNSENFHVVWRG